MELSFNPTSNIPENLVASEILCFTKSKMSLTSIQQDFKFDNGRGGGNTGSSHLNHNVVFRAREAAFPGRPP